MSINLTLFGQLIAFTFFVIFCMKYVWPPLLATMEARQKKISEGLDAADRARLDLEKAQQQAEAELAEAKSKASEIIEQASKRASQIVEEAKGDARTEAERIVRAAEAEVAQEVVRAKEALRSQVSALALQGAERILGAAVNDAAHAKLVDDIASSL